MKRWLWGLCVAQARCFAQASCVEPDEASLHPSATTQDIATHVKTDDTLPGDEHPPLAVPVPVAVPLAAADSMAWEPKEPPPPSALGASAMCGWTSFVDVNEADDERAVGQLAPLYVVQVLSSMQSQDMDTLPFACKPGE